MQSGIGQAAFFTVSDLFKAYRKAKSDAFQDRTHFNAIAFSKYEQRLERNLKRLLDRLLAPSPSWCVDSKLIGSFSFLPKSVEIPAVDDDRLIHYATLDPVRDWIDQCSTVRKPMKAGFRQIMTPSVDYLIISALWIMKVGHKFDSAIDRDLSYAHSVRRVGKNGPVAEDAHHLFVPYMDGYRRWRSRGLRAMQSALRDKKSIVAVTMDVERYYHSVSPNFLLRPQFLRRLGVDLTKDERDFTSQLVASINHWYATTPDAKKRPEGALPVGLTASRVISNVLLAEFDRVVAGRTKAVYYGRYADDIFLVVPMPDGVKTGEGFIKWLRQQMEGWLVLKPAKEGSGLRLDLPYAKDSQIVFSSTKQKMFFLEGEHGLDLLDQITEKIREYSSEYRDLPELPSNESQMAAQALLASPDARLEADALRKAEAVSIRRLGFSMLLSDVEAYARDLAPDEWRSIRHKFYGLVLRYVLTPTGVFDYFVYIVRVFGLMVACRDEQQASNFLDRFEHVMRVVARTTTAGGADRSEFNQMRRHYLRGFSQSALCAATVANFKVTNRFRVILARAQRRRLQQSAAAIWLEVHALLRSDQGRRPYHEYWFDERRVEKQQPPLPADFSVRRVLALTKQFRNKVAGGLGPPYWPAIAFATRPIPLWKLCISAPSLLSEGGGVEKVIWATRGAHVNPRYRDFSFFGFDDDGFHILNVPGHLKKVRKFGVPSYLTSGEQWQTAFDGKPDKSLARYEGVRRLINRMLRECSDVDYIAFPECSLPLDWLLPIAQTLGARGVSLIAGVENHGAGANYTNEALVSLSSNFFGKRGALCFIQPKLALAHEEAKKCSENLKIFTAPPPDAARPVYLHGGLCLAVLICSDLTTIANRAFFQGRIDSLFVLEWNKDLATFEFLVESTAHDLHACVVQINNREYGDSRIRMPFERSYRRDVVQVKGGEQDFFVVASVDFAALREFQRKPTEGSAFKPMPIGYKMSPYRKNATIFGGW